ncbi:MAG: hypothetical protein H6912_04970 [Kordiimonadaceae bacterium]|nr:hypothetical protein [Kordiimonadaceae bacterium]
MQDQLKEYGVNFVQTILLFAVLAVPQIIAKLLISAYGLTEVGPYLIIFIGMVSVGIVFYGIMLNYRYELVGRIYDLVYLKFLIVIFIFFFIVYDGYMLYFNQEAFFIQHSKIVRRDIVWRDVPFADLPEYVVYPNFTYAFQFCLSLVRVIFELFLIHTLMSERKEPLLKKKVTQRQRLRSKSVEELKANLHPSILKKYENDNHQNKNE